MTLRGHTASHGIAVCDICCERPGLMGAVLRITMECRSRCSMVATAAAGMTHRDAVHADAAQEQKALKGAQLAFKAAWQLLSLWRLCLVECVPFCFIALNAVRERSQRGCTRHTSWSCSLRGGASSSHLAAAAGCAAGERDQAHEVMPARLGDPSGVWVGACTLLQGQVTAQKEVKLLRIDDALARRHLDCHLQARAILRRCTASMH